MKYLKELLILLPVGLGLLASILAQLFFRPVPLLVFKIDVGMVIFILGAFLSLLLVMIRLGGLNTEKEARKRINHYQREHEESRRQFIRRLDHEIKNPLTGLRTALVNLREAGAANERERAAENASRAAERLT